MARVAERLAILGQPVRLRLIELLREGSSAPQELSDALGLSQQNVSKHLLSLYRTGVVARRPDGANVFYSLADQTAVTILCLAVESVSGHLRDLARLAANPQVATTDTGGAPDGRSPAKVDDGGVQHVIGDDAPGTKR